MVGRSDVVGRSGAHLQSLRIAKRTQQTEESIAALVLLGGVVAQIGERDSLSESLFFYTPFIMSKNNLKPYFKIDAIMYIVMILMIIFLVTVCA